MPGSAVVLMPLHLVDTQHKKLPLLRHPPKAGTRTGVAWRFSPLLGSGFNDSQSALFGCATVAAPGPEGAPETVAVGRGKCEP